MKRIFEINVNEKAPITIDIKIGGKDCIAIIDTGSNISICDSEFVIVNKIPHGEIKQSNISVVSQHSQETSSPFDTTISFKDYKWRYYSFKGKSMNIKHLQEAMKNMIKKPLVAIVGTDWLKEHNAVIDIENKTLTIEPK